MRAKLKQIGRFLSRHFQLIAICLTVPGIIWAVYSQRQAIADFDPALRPTLLLAAIALLALGPILQAVSFWDALRAFGARPGLVDVVLVWCRSFLLRYSPGGALSFVYRVRQRARLDGDNKEILAATAYEQYAALQAALTVAVIFFVIDGGPLPIWAVALFSAGLLIALLVRPALLGRAVKKIMASRGVELPELLHGRRVIPIVALNIAAWLFVAWGNWLLLAGLAPEAEINFLYFSASFLLACAVGIIVPMLPGGLGVREATLVLLLAPVMSPGPATALAIGLRIAATIAEFVAIGFGEIAYFIGKKVTRK